jgi:cation diffusion facilitator CzcD-associated flavoprotein CzcO
LRKHTGRFPREGVDFTGKRVAVVGTGATAVQVIREITQQAKWLTVFQRTASYCVPARNGKVDPELMKARKADYDGIVRRIKESFFGQEHYFILKSAVADTGRHANEVLSATLLPYANSWYMSANIAGKPRAFLPYLGPEGVGGYRKKCA